MSPMMCDGVLTEKEKYDGEKLYKMMNRLIPISVDVYVATVLFIINEYQNCCQV